MLAIQETVQTEQAAAVDVEVLAQHIKAVLCECSRAPDGKIVHRCGTEIEVREVAAGNPSWKPQKFPYCPACKE